MRVKNLLAFFLAVLIGISADGLAQKVTELFTAAQNVAVPESPDISNGEAVRIRITRRGKNLVRITATNVSNQTVYLPYLGYENTEEAYYAIWGMERLNPGTGHFEPYEGGCIATGLHPLDPGKSYYIDYGYERGTYRTTVGYVSDKALVDRIKNFHSLDGDELKAERERFDALGDTGRAHIPPVTFTVYD